MNSQRRLFGWRSSLLGLAVTFGFLQGGMRQGLAGQSDPQRFDLFRHLSTQPIFFKEWPVTKDRLVFLWKNGLEPVSFRDTQGETRSIALRAKDGAKLGPRGEMRTPKGLFLADAALVDAIRASCMATNQLAIEAVVTPAVSLQSGPARIISFSGGLGRRNFTLGQEGAELIFRLQTTETSANGSQYHLAALKPGKPQHVIVTYRPGLLVCYVDGKLSSRTATGKGRFDQWAEYELYFGRERGGRRKWEGTLEGIAIYSRFVGEDEARRKYDVVAREFGLPAKP